MGSGSGLRKFCSKHRTPIIIAVVAVIGLSLGLGLGLGLGLKSKNSDVPSQRGCATVKRQSGRKFWAKPQIPTECPISNEQECPEGKKDPTLFILSMDGFRADYLLRNMTPMLNYLSRCGVHAPYMRSVFPTKTFPNHYTIATGLYPESHGIIDNTFYDPSFKEMFSFGGQNNNDNRWWGGEPIWNTAIKAGKRAAVMMFPGSDVNIQNIRPDKCYDYDSSINLDDRVIEALQWFDGPPSEFPDLAVLYFEQPDSAGHAQGPFGDWVTGNLSYVDNLINQLYSGLKERKMEKCVNFVILADHGMDGVDCGRVVYLSQFMDDTSKYYIYSGVHARMTSKYRVSSKKKKNKKTFYAVDDNQNSVPVEETLNQLKCHFYNNSKDWYIRFHAKEDLPKRYHFSNNERIDEIVMDIEEGYYLDNEVRSPCTVTGGAHGYDNSYKSMHALFIAYGPSLKQGMITNGFENIELYNFFSKILGVIPSSNNGTADRLSHLLKNFSPSDQLISVFSEDDRCPFPNDLEMKTRQNQSNCAKPSSACLGSITVDVADAQLNLTESESVNVIERILPFGLPSLPNVTHDLCILVQMDYIAGYSKKYNMPLWTAFSIDNNTSRMDILDGHYRTNGEYESCSRTDIRLSDPMNCSSYHNDTNSITWNHIFPPDLVKSNVSWTDALLSTNIVPMYERFKKGIWREMLHLLEEYAVKYDDLHVLIGPVFDYNADGLSDAFSDIKHFVNSDHSVPLPSHYFVIVMATFDGNFTNIMSFVLHHQQLDINCRDQLPVPEEYLRQNVARVRDIELLTGLRFFEALGLFHRVDLLTYLPEELWKRMSWMDVVTNENDDCPDLSSNECSSNPPLILISIDGFKPDYLEKKLSPVLERLNKCGVSTPYMKSIYPTMTFPNHHTISTGLYPESHGIIDNNMFDLTLNQSFYLGSPNSFNPKWWHGEPIWNTVKKSNKSAMAFFWPGSDVEIGEERPDEYFVYNGQVPYNVRVDTALKWLNGSGSTGSFSQLIILYFSKVDESGHEGGPGSYQVDEAIEHVEKSLLQLMDGIYRLKLHTCINLIIVSDHGMSDIACERTVPLEEFLLPPDLSNIYVYPGTAGRISNKYIRRGNDYFTVPESEQTSVDELVNKLRCISNMIPFDKREMPRRHHYINNDRIDDVLLYMDDTWMAGTTPWCPIKGQHGYDPGYDSMKAFFVGYGPSFKDKYAMQPFENVELYNIMAYLTNSTAAPNNGTEGSLYDMLRHSPDLPLISSSKNYTDCLYPMNDEDYERRANQTSFECQCSSESEIKEWDDRLNLTKDNQKQLEDVHLSHGRPALESSENEEDICILHHHDFVSGYSHLLKMPLWTAFNITRNQLSTNDTPLINCTRPDVRLDKESDQVTCLQYKQHPTIPVHLFPPEWSTDEDSTDAFLLTNFVPMHKIFITDVWDLMVDYIANITKTFNQIHVVFGPIFDYNGDGLGDKITRLKEQSAYDILVPSHYYIITLHCNGTQACVDMTYDPLTFILPHKNNSRSENCQDFIPFLLQNVARIRDVELLTGLTFLTANRTQQSIKTRVYTPIQLWE